MSHSHASLALDILVISLLTSSHQSIETFTAAAQSAGQDVDELGMTACLLRLTRDGVAEPDSLHESFKMNPVYATFNTVDTPTFSPAAGNYLAAQSVAISSTIGATIHYTTDNSTPTKASAVYTGPISVAVNKTLKAMANKSTQVDSTIGTAAYTIQVNTPTFSPAAGAYVGTQTVTVSNATSGVTMYYTTDGSTPTTGSTGYSVPVSVASSETLKVLAVKSGLTDSAVGAAAYTIQVHTPTFSPVAGTYTGTQTVTVSNATAGTSMYYTTDGSAPTTGSTAYSTPISVDATETVKVLAVKAGLADSAIGSADYVIN